MGVCGRTRHASDTCGRDGCQMVDTAHDPAEIALPMRPDLMALLSLIPAGSRHVAIFGGGAEELAAALRRRDPAASIETADRTQGGLDALVWIDLLAHQSDPTAALREAAAMLSPTGVLVASVRNPEHWILAAQLLRGGWRYGSGNPLDTPHLRLLTRDATAAAIRAAGLVPHDATPDGVEIERAAEFTRAMTPALQSLGVEPRDYLRRASAARHLWRAGPQRAEPLVIVAHALKPVGGVNDVRIDLPLNAMATHPGVAVRIAQNPELPDLPPETPRIALLHRRLLNSPDAPAYIHRFRARGWIVVQEFDDDPDHWPVIAASNHFAFRGVHAVQTTTAPLRALFSAWNEEVAVFPNTVAELPDPGNFRDPQRLTLFLGALRREEDTAPFLPALNAVLAEAGERLAVEVLFDRGTFESLATPHKRFRGLLPYAEYRAAMARCELAFLPLAETRFNGFKSDLKFVEAGAHRLAVLASPVVYGAAMRDGATGLIIRTAEELRVALRRLLAHPEEAQALGDAARHYVKGQRMLSAQVRERLAWYRALWARRAELDAALLRRAPECGR